MPRSAPPACRRSSAPAPTSPTPPTRCCACSAIIGGRLTKPPSRGECEHDHLPAGAGRRFLCTIHVPSNEDRRPGRLRHEQVQEGGCGTECGLEGDAAYCRDIESSACVARLSRCDV